MQKRCFKCSRVLPIAEFYDHPRMGDGTLNKCKDCTKGDVKANYAVKRERYSVYDRRRNRRAERRAARMVYQRRAREREPLKYKARMAVGNAIRDGRLIRQPCHVCGAKAQAHHHNYSKPFDVEWLCFKHHRETGHGQTVTEVAA